MLDVAQILAGALVAYAFRAAAPGGPAPWAQAALGIGVLLAVLGVVRLFVRAVDALTSVNY